MTDTTPRSVKVLQECAELQLKEWRDYQKDESSVTQADYFPSGIRTIYENMNAKMLQMRSIIENVEGSDRPSARQFPDGSPEYLDDIAKGLINDASLFVSYMHYGVSGQDSWHDLFNTPISLTFGPSPQVDDPQTAVEKQAEYARKKCKEWIEAQEKREADQKEVDNG